jgi:protoporphyrinogen oxidase
MLGGLAGAWSIGDVIWDRHYHVTLLSDMHLRGLLVELGLDEELQWSRTRTGFFTDGRLHSMSNTLEFLKFPPLGLWDKLRLGWTIWHASRLHDWQSLERMSASEWLIRHSGQRTYEKIWLPLLRAKLGDNYQYASAAFIWAIIARMYAARRTGYKHEMFGYVRGGYARVLARFTAYLQSVGVWLHGGLAVDQVVRTPDGIGVECSDGSTGTFDRVVVTTPAPTVINLCPELNAEEKSRLAGVRYQGIICASMLLDRPLGGYYVTNITDPGLPFTAVIEMTALVKPEELGGQHLVYLPRYVVPEDELFNVPDRTIEESFFNGLRRIYPDLTRSNVKAFRVSRVRHVLAISTQNYSRNLPGMLTSVPGLFIVNSAQIVPGTLNVNETIQLANQAALKLVRHSEAASASEEKVPC